MTNKNWYAVIPPKQTKMALALNKDILLTETMYQSIYLFIYLGDHSELLWLDRYQYSIFLAIKLSK